MLYDFALYLSGVPIVLVTSTKYAWNKYNIINIISTIVFLYLYWVQILYKLNYYFKGTGVYILNPHYFGIGDWSSLKGLRMTIEYTEQGKNISVSTIEKEDTNLKIAK